MNVLQVPVEKAVQMISETPATIAKINANVGTLSAGKRAGIQSVNTNSFLQFYDILRYFTV